MTCTKCKKSNIRHYEYTLKDFVMLRHSGEQQKTKLANFDFKDTIVFKPWGFEYLFMKDHNSCGWMLHIDEGLSTSLHCHSAKNTVVYVISGILLLKTLNSKQMLMSGDLAYIDAQVFHAMCAVKKDTRVIEIETPSDKCDAIRGIDYWKRKGQPYESKCLLLTLTKSSEKKEKGKKEKR